jgi:hypothetical protein
MNSRMPRATILVLIISITCSIFFSLSLDANAGCRWVWNGINSQWVCEDDMDKGPAKLCNFEEKRSKRGTRFTVSSYCRKDGSIWKEVIVRPRAVVVKLYSPDGRLLERNKIATEGYNHSSYRGDRRDRRDRERVRDISGNYVGRVVAGRMLVSIQQRKRNLGIRADVYNFLGQKDTFHFEGKLKGNRIIAKHDSGHRFTGLIVARGVIEGMVNMRDGRRIGLTLHKR